ncbi:MAG: immune inhibitor A domain-containing protein [Tumebacillaceae bacterium]
MKKVWLTMLAGALVTGTVFTGTANAQTSGGAGAIQEGDLDIGVINEEKVLELLQKEGVIAPNATEEQKTAALRSYVEQKNQPSYDSSDDAAIATQVKKTDAANKNSFKGFNNGLLNGNGKKNGHYKKQPDPVQESVYTGPVHKAKVLVLATEFSDFTRNNIKPGESDNYYTDYPLEHYEDMIFGENGVEGPSGQNFLSVKQFYDQQSGGSFDVEGKAYGWLKLPKPAKFYGADGKTGHDNVAPGGSKQLMRDLYTVAKNAGVPLQDYDLEDPHDLDSDGNKYEPDGLVDHLMVIHAGMGQEAGGGVLGNDAIWSHRSAILVDPDGLGKGLPGFYDYMQMPEDGATGVFAHEFGHDLGVPDEYDTIYSGKGEPVSSWSIMANGSWAGKIPGTEPTGFSPWAKSYYQNSMGGNWTAPTVVNWSDVTAKGSQFLLDQANAPNGQNNTAIQVNLPMKAQADLAPKTGSYQFWGGRADKLDNIATATVDLTGKASAQLTFDAWYKSEEQWDFSMVQVSTDGASWTSLSNANTTSAHDPQADSKIVSNLPGFTGNSNGWQAQAFDLSAYAGQKIQVRFRTMTDSGYNEEGFYVDNVKVTADGATVLEDGAENANSAFALNGFTRHDGNKYTNHYYLLEWRNHAGVDKGLGHISVLGQQYSYDPGLVVWYVDNEQTENWVGVHPGKGFLGVVDAHTNPAVTWNGNTVASTRYQLHDAAFGLNATSPMNLLNGALTMNEASRPGVSLFDDSNSFWNTAIPDAGRDLPNYGLKIRVNGQAADKSVGAIVLYK